jgi:hypothetical protein
MKADLRKAVIQVGDGRGFIAEPCAPVRGSLAPILGRLVVAAAHCLPWLPPACAVSYQEEITYQKLLGPLGQEPTVWAECLFVDPIADIAVLGSPDNQELVEQAEAYEEFTEQATALSIGKSASGKASLLTLEGEWSSCTVERMRYGHLFIENAIGGIRHGMSGSPIIDERGRAIGVVVAGGDVGGPSPSLVDNLPRWLLSQLRIVARRKN